jgi:hypothetical protein
VSGPLSGPSGAPAPQIEVISMKSAAAPAPPKVPGERAPRAVKLRPLDDSAARQRSAGALGRLAPPRAATVVRRTSSWVKLGWAAAALALAAAIAGGMWLVAR